MGADAGAALLAGGRFHEAAAHYGQQLRRDPASVEARLGLGRALAGSGDALAAAAWFSDAMRLAPDAPAPLQLLADIELQQRHFAQALPLYRRLLVVFGLRSPGNLLNAGFCEEQAGALQEAAALYRAVLAAAPRQLEAHVNLAGLLWRLEDFEGALRHARQAVALAPDHASAQRILGTALLHLDRLEEAEQHLRRALALQPDHADARLDLAFTLLQAGRLQEGWPLWEERWRGGRVQRPAFWQPAHEWPGPQVPLAGKTVAVYGEQGYGDVLQVLRYVPRLQALGARVCGVFPPELVPLVEASFPDVACLGPGRRLEVDLHAALLDLPGRLGTTLDTIPADVPYLQPPAAARAAWRERLAPWRGRARIGLCWSGSATQVNNRNRALPLSLLLPLARLPGVQCFSLQKDAAPAWTDSEPAPGELVDLTGAWRDFGDSAAMLAELDLVVTVDTALAHLAGALGKPVWILLGPNADWRWLRGRADSPWYPTARLFRRAHGQSRAEQAARVHDALRAWLPGRSGS